MKVLTFEEWKATGRDVKSLAPYIGTDPKYMDMVSGRVYDAGTWLAYDPFEEDWWTELDDEKFIAETYAELEEMLYNWLVDYGWYS